ncbi:hypothetical protein [Salinibaculum salinum]|uniref:hypothetical protein n=1 Tax=Salinibaculum salinum TaxID=3131996 RepID=UPI0030ED77AD
MPGVPTLNDVRRGLENPVLTFDHVRHQLRLRARRYHGAVHRRLSEESPTNVLDEDWENLIILDGCRYDTFEACNSIDGDLQSRISLGSQSWEFLRRNFAGKSVHDTVYVTANPFATRLGDDVFHAVVDLLDEWDDKLQTVPPEAVAAAALDAHEEFPEKRLLVHFMQPHYPFIGERGRTLDVRGYSPTQDDGFDAPSVWQILRHDHYDDDGITRETVTEAYRENLSLALPHVEKIVSELPGRSVVTADHGNLLGERLYPIPVREYGHPRGLYSPALVRVPWLVVDDGQSRPITSDPPVDQSTPDADVVSRRLSALGYRA